MADNTVTILKLTFRKFTNFLIQISASTAAYVSAIEGSILSKTNSF